MYMMDGRDGLPRHEVLNYLHRVTPNQKTVKPQSQGRYFERFKCRLDELGISYETTVNPGEGSIFRLTDIVGTKSLVDRLLEQEGEPNGKENEEVESYDNNMCGPR